MIERGRRGVEISNEGGLLRGSWATTLGRRTGNTPTVGKGCQANRVSQQATAHFDCAKTRIPAPMCRGLARQCRCREDQSFRAGSGRREARNEQAGVKRAIALLRGSGLA